MNAISANGAPVQSAPDLGNKISVAVAKKSLDVAKSQGAAALSMIQNAARIAPGQNQSSRPGGIDIVA